MEATIFSIQPFSLHDGPGIRTTVFFKGCNLHCYWCHNPESICGTPELQFFAAKCTGCGACVQVCPKSIQNQSARFTARCLQCGACTEACFSEALVLSGTKYTVEALFKIFEDDKETFMRSGGGVTFSGGEPLLQAPFVYEMLKLCKADGIDTAIETALNVPWETVAPLLPYTDHVLCDLKTMNPHKHRNATGKDNTRILQNIQNLCEVHPDVLVRTPIIPGFNDTVADIAAVADFLASLSTPPKAELLPFHGLCVGKYNSLNRTYKAASCKTPNKSVIEHFAALYQERNILVYF